MKKQRLLNGHVAGTGIPLQFSGNQEKPQGDGSTNAGPDVDSAERGHLDENGAYVAELGEVLGQEQGMDGHEEGGSSSGEPEQVSARRVEGLQGEEKVPPKTETPFEEDVQGVLPGRNQDISQDLLHSFEAQLDDNFTDSPDVDKNLEGSFGEGHLGNPSPREKPKETFSAVLQDVRESGEPEEAASAHPAQEGATKELAGGPEDADGKGRAAVAEAGAATRLPMEGLGFGEGQPDGNGVEGATASEVKVPPAERNQPRGGICPAVEAEVGWEGQGRGAAKGKGRMRQSPRKRGPSGSLPKGGSPEGGLHEAAAERALCQGGCPAGRGSGGATQPARHSHPQQRPGFFAQETSLLGCAHFPMPAAFFLFGIPTKSGLRDGQEGEKLSRPFTPLSRPNLPRSRGALGGAGGGLTWTPKAASGVQGPPPCPRPPPHPYSFRLGLGLFQRRVAKPGGSRWGPDS